MCRGQFYVEQVQGPGDVVLSCAPSLGPGLGADILLSRL